MIRTEYFKEYRKYFWNFIPLTKRSTHEDVRELYTDIYNLLKNFDRLTGLTHNVIGNLGP